VTDELCVVFSLKYHVTPAIYISTSGCTELTTVSHTDSHLIIGAGVTIGQLEASLDDLLQQLPGID